MVHVSGAATGCSVFLAALTCVVYGGIKKSFVLANISLVGTQIIGLYSCKASKVKKLYDFTFVVDEVKFDWPDSGLDNGLRDGQDLRTMGEDDDLDEPLGKPCCEIDGDCESCS